MSCFYCTVLLILLSFVAAVQQERDVPLLHRLTNVILINMKSALMDQLGSFLIMELSVYRPFIVQVYFQIL